jgi:hypothetical protein
MICRNARLSHRGGEDMGLLGVPSFLPKKAQKGWELDAPDNY